MQGGSSSQDDKDKPIEWLGIPLPQPVSDDLRLAEREWNGIRKSVIQALPSGIVNNSTNVFALGHIGSEIMLFKGNNTIFVPQEHRGTWWRYITEPPQSIVKSVFGKAGTTVRWADLARPQFYLDSARNLVDLKHATEMDKAGGAFLINRWSARSTFAGFTGVLLSGLAPDAKDTQADVEKMTQLARDNPLGYVGTRLGQAVAFPFEAIGGVARKLSGEKEDTGIGKHKREFAGLGLTISGIFSFLSGFRNVEMIDPAVGKMVASNLRYGTNGAHAFGGLVTALAGANLLFAMNNDQGWSRYGSIMLARTVTLPMAINKKFMAKEANANWYAGGQAGMVTSNTFSALVGSADKAPDGSITDHKAIEKQAKKDIEKHAQEKPATTMHTKDIEQHETPEKEQVKVAS